MNVSSEVRTQGNALGEKSLGKIREDREKLKQEKGTLRRAFFIGRNGEIYNASITDVRRVYISSGYAADEQADLVLSACDKAGLQYEPGAKNSIILAVQESIKQNK